MTSANKALTLIGPDAVGKWRPTICATVDDAQQLALSVLILAFNDIEAERRSGSEIPPAHIKKVDPETGEIQDMPNPAFEMLVEERALYYLQSIGYAAEAAEVAIIADIRERELYKHHPDGWEALSQFLRSISAGKSQFYYSTVERLVGVVLPFIQVEQVTGTGEIMDIIVKGGKSALLHLTPELVHAVEGRDVDQVKEILHDAKTLGRSEWYPKYKDHSTIPPAQAQLRHTNPGWELIITMTDAQKEIILKRLSTKIEYV
jgi:hypothetical protein